MIKTIRNLLLLTTALFGGGSTLIAQDAESPLKSELQAFLVIAGERGDELTETDEVQPGGLVEYLLTFTNQSDGPLNRILATGIIPPETVVLPGTLTQPEGLQPRFSIDNGESFHLPPVTYTVTKEDGSLEVKTATPDMYQQIRWEIPSLPPAKSLRFTYRVRVK